MSKVVRVNVKTGKVTTEDLKKGYETFGQRGFIAKFMTDEVDPKTDPMGPGNKFIVATGIFAGTTLPSAHRLSVGGKSPLTNGIKEANVGGNAGFLMAQHGFKAIVLEDGPAKDWQLLHIAADGKISLVPAKGYAGLNNYELVGKIKGQYGERVGVLSIGMAGERGYRNSSVQLIDAGTGHPSRAAARGGMGAVMGSKKIKAIVFEPASSPASFPYADREKFAEAVKKIVEFTRADTFPMAGFRNVGTIGNVDMTGFQGFLPVKNYSGAFFPKEKINKINGATFMNNLNKRGGKNQIACQPGCLVRCSNSYNGEDGQYLTSSLEYETVALIGSNCMIDDLDAIAKMDRMCDDLGIDTIETGATIGVCMESGKIPWGDAKAAIALVQEMMDGTEFGKVMGQGTESTGKKLGVKRIPTVKGQSLSGYEPRNAQIVGVTFATTPMGADHTAGVGMPPNSDLMGRMQRVAMSGMMQRGSALCDNYMCMFANAFTMVDASLLPTLFEAAYGGKWDAAKINQIGADTVTMEAAFNKKAGMTAKDDDLPEFFHKEIASSSGAIFDVTQEDMTSTLRY